MPSPSHLSRAQRSVLLDLLQSRLAALGLRQRDQSGGLTHADAAYQERPQDDEEMRDRAGVQEVEGTLSDIDAAEEAALDTALQRIHAEAYGLCLDCGDPIPFERLQIEPQTLRCVACQTGLEHRVSP